MKTKTNPAAGQRCRCYINARYYSRVMSSGQGTLKGYVPCPVHEAEIANQDAKIKAFDFAPLLDQETRSKAQFIASAATLEKALAEARGNFPGAFIYCGHSHFAVHRKSGEPALFRIGELRGE